MNTDNPLEGSPHLSFIKPTRPALEIPGAITPVEGAELGVNQAMLKDQGLPISIDSSDIKPGDNVLVYIDGRLVLVLPVKNDYRGEPITQYIPANRVPEGIITLSYRVNVEQSAPRKVRVKTRLPGGMDPAPDAPGHHLLAAPHVTSLTLNGQQDETVIVPAYEGMSPNDGVTLKLGDWALPHTVKAEEVGHTLTFTLSTDMIAQNGDGEFMLYYTLCDELQNPASDHSLGRALTIQRGTNKPVGPTVEGADEQHILDLSRLGSRSANIDLDTRGFAPGDTLKLCCTGLDRTGQLKVVTEEQTLETGSTPNFKIANAVLQELAGGSARLFFTHTDASGATRNLPSTEIFIVGNARRVGSPDESANQSAPVDVLAAPDIGVLKIDVPIILGSTIPVVGGDCGVSLRIYDDSNLNGARVIIDSLEGGQEDDVIDLILNTVIIDTTIVEKGTENSRHELTIFKGLLNPNVVNLLQASVTRVSGNADISEPPLRVLYNAIRPGNRDRDDDPGHSELQLKLPQDILDNGLSADRAARGVEVSFCYPYCRPYDVIHLTMGGLIVQFTVLPSELPPFVSDLPVCVVRTLTAEQFRQAGDSPRFTLFYTVQDQIKNGPDPLAPYSKQVVIDVDLAGVRRPGPIFVEDPNDTSDDPSTIELEKLAGRNLIMVIMTPSPAFAINDTIRATYRSPPSPDYFLDGTVSGQFGQPYPLLLEIPNNLVISERTVFGSYVQSRNGVPIANSRETQARVIGQGIPDLPAPQVIIAPNGVLDPRDNPLGAIARVTVPGFAPGDQVRLLVRGTAGNGSPTFSPVPLNASGQAEFPLNVAFINANLGQFVRVSYLFIRDSVEKESRILDLSVLNQTQAPIVTSIITGDSLVPNNGETYYQNNIIIQGRATPQQQVFVLDGDRNLGRYAVDDNGDWFVPERNFAVERHVITAQSVNGGQPSQPYSFTVRQGLLADVANFGVAQWFGWGPLPANNPFSFSFYTQTGWGYYALKVVRTSGTEMAVALYKTFDNLQPGATYEFRVAAMSQGPTIRLRLSTGEQSVAIRPNPTVWQETALSFVPKTPSTTLYVENALAGWMGLAWIRIIKTP
ncbi:hypothetical protein [Pseudomonas sp. NPDC096950]|uniref:hypothetical protein n=1 Tax=Pseudomonas sp. NPDC096950 TaxID=3364485 RepID=UPI00383B89A5